MNNVLVLHRIKQYPKYHTIADSLTQLFTFMINHLSTVSSDLRSQTIISNHSVQQINIDSHILIVNKQGLTNLLLKNIKHFGTLKRTHANPMQWYGCESNVQLLKSVKGSLEKYTCVVLDDDGLIKSVQEVFGDDFYKAYDEISFNFTKQTRAEHLIAKNYHAVANHQYSTQRSLHNVLKYALPSSKFGQYLLKNISSVNHNTTVALCVKPKKTYLQELDTKAYLAKYSPKDLQLYKALLIHHRRIRYFGAMSYLGLPHVLSRSDAVRFLGALLQQVKQ